MMEHVRDDLSAYLDGALTPARRATVEGHLGGCAGCRAALGELRTTAKLISALPAPAPSRRLVPALAPARNWLRPLRSLSAVAAATFLFVFMASATLDTGFRMGGGAAGTGAASRATSAERGAPAAAFQTALPAAAPQATASVQAAPAVKDQAAGSAAAEAPAPPRIGPTPWLWLALTVLSAALALVAHRRLRAR